MGLDPQLVDLPIHSYMKLPSIAPSVTAEWPPDSNIIIFFCAADTEFFSLRKNIKILYKKTTVHTKWLVYYRRSCFSTLELHVSLNWRATSPNTQRDRSLVWLLSILRTIRCVPAFYIPNEFSTIADVSFQLYDPMLAPTGELPLWTHTAIPSSYNILCVHVSYKK